MNSIVRIGALAGALGVTMLTAYAGTIRRSLQNHEIVVDQELLITAQEVVDSSLADYPGPWSFGHLMTESYGEKKVAAEVVQWLEQWADGKGRTIAGRDGVRRLLIEPWQKADGYDPASETPWVPNFENAPFQLLAIANRMDLSVPPLVFNDPDSRLLPLRAAYYGSPDGFDSRGGEGRLIFAVTDQEGVPLEPGVTLIFEYGLDIGNQQDRFLDWAMAWHDLGTHEKHDATYRASLAKVTRAFTDRRKSLPKSKVLGKLGLIDRLTHVRSGPTQLMRIRTNDGAFGEVREFREFAWTAKGFDHAALAGTPKEVFFREGTEENRWLARWLRVMGTEKATVAIARDDAQSEVPNSFALPAGIRIRGRMEPIVAFVAQCLMIAAAGACPLTNRDGQHAGHIPITYSGLSTEHHDIVLW